MHETVAWHKRNEESFTHYFFVEGIFFLELFLGPFLANSCYFIMGFLSFYELLVLKVDKFSFVRVALF